MSETRLPWMKIHTRDTLGDSNLTGASLAARTAFWPILCLMHESPRRGYLLDSKGNQYTVIELAKLCHMRKETMTSALAELVDRHVFCTESSTVFDTKTVQLLYQKRMVNEDENRTGARARKADSRAKNKENERNTPNAVTPNVTGRDQRSEIRDQNPEKRREEKASRTRARTHAQEPPAFCWVAGEGWEGITDTDRAKWATAYPTLNISTELARADAWLTANPDKAPKDRWPAFVIRWLSRSSDKQAASPAKKPDEPFNPWDIDEMVKRLEPQNGIKR